MKILFLSCQGKILIVKANTFSHLRLSTREFINGLYAEGI